jgi:hypothetical protein
VPVTAVDVDVLCDIGILRDNQTKKDCQHKSKIKNILGENISVMKTIQLANISNIPGENILVMKSNSISYQKQ